MKIVILTQYFSPENVRIPDELAAGLRSRGHSIKVLTTFPNYPIGRVFPGFKQTWLSRSVKDGIEINRVPSYPDHSTRSLARAANYLTFAFASLLATPLVKGADVVYVYAPQLTPALGPWVWRKFSGPPYVLHIQDLWPESVIDSSVATNKTFKTVFRFCSSRWALSVYRAASRVVAISPTMRRFLIDRGVEPGRARAVLNWVPQTASVAPIDPSQAPGITRILYAGNLGSMQDLGTVIHAAALAAAYGVEMRIIGAGMEEKRLKAFATDLNATNVSFMEAIPEADMQTLYSWADFGIVPLKNLPIFEATIPSKIQGLVARGIPVLTSIRGDVARMVEDHGIGFTCQPESVEDMVRMFKTAAHTTPTARALMSSRALQLADEVFSFEAALEKIEKILEEAAQHRP